MPFTKILAVVGVLALWSTVAWLIAHERRIARELVRDEAMPRPGPRANFLVLISFVLTGFSGLLLYVIFS